MGKLFVDESRSSKILKEGLRVVVGNGERVTFWRDLSCDSIPLNSAFSMIHALASNKNEAINDFVRRMTNDALAWSFYPNSFFKVGLFMRCLEEENVKANINSKLLWQEICPPKYLATKFFRKIVDFEERAINKAIARKTANVNALGPIDVEGVVAPRINPHVAMEEDEFLILASDVLWDVMSVNFACIVVTLCLREENLVTAAENHSSRELENGYDLERTVFLSKAKRAFAILCRMALARRSRDNISVIVIDLRNRTS
ncbi:hypothetical protein EZV62_005738 [Acer yangbiense]|uniref:PPM-type phosphatase domain-containing protein n=1 Tax=Acer yangbiense TaxID=1000413 RepID=A0A5C7IN75_9ROSI|nr:hypothetical protein EZV62_005738 [Acer yangbiense]